MKKIGFKSAIECLKLLPFLLLLTACSGDDYVNVIPQNSTAVISVDMPEMAKRYSDDGEKVNVLKELFKVDDLKDCGIALSSKLYAFETVDGNLCVLAKVGDKNDVKSWLEKLAKDGYAKNTTKRKDYSFTVINDSWMVGYSSSALLVMGPVLPVQQAEAQQQMVKLLEQDEEHSIKGTPLFAKLDSIDSPVAMVAQAAALPEKFVAPFTIGAPKGADASQIMIAAELNTDIDGCLEIKGETFSFNKDIDKALKANKNVFRPITGKYVSGISSDDALGAFMNVDGKEFINLLHSNKAFQALLAGMNTVIDMDNIIKSIDGDMAIVMPALQEEGMNIRMMAQLTDKKFLNDVDYWKQSCPKGSRIDGWGTDAYYFTDGSMSFYFGVSEDMQFYSGSTPDEARNSIKVSPKPFSQSVQDKIKGQRLCLLLNINAVIGGDDKSDALSSFAGPLLGNIRTVLYSMK